MAASLLAGLRNVLANLGAWLLDELLAEGVLACAAYCRMYARKLADRRARGKSDRRRAMLAARAQRWLAAARWLTRQAQRLHRAALLAYAPTFADLPRQSPLESMEPN